MVGAGILSEDDRVELINGELLQMSPIGSEHSAMVGKIKDWLILQTYGKAIIRVQDPVIATNFAEPQPDIAVVTFRDDYYKKEHPKAADVLLIIEVADSSLVYDREIKLPVYAEAGIPEYWIVNLPARQIEAYREPTGKDYRIRELFQAEDEWDFPALSLHFTAREFLG